MRSSPGRMFQGIQWRIFSCSATYFIEPPFSDTPGQIMGERERKKKEQFTFNKMQISGRVFYSLGGPIFVIYLNYKIKEILAIPRWFQTEHFPKISEHFWKLSEDCLKVARKFPNIFRKVPEIFEVYRRLPNISEQYLKMFWTQK